MIAEALKIAVLTLAVAGCCLAVGVIVIVVALGLNSFLSKRRVPPAAPGLPSPKDPAGSPTPFLTRTNDGR